MQIKKIKKTNDETTYIPYPIDQSEGHNGNNKKNQWEGNKNNYFKKEKRRNSGKETHRRQHGEETYQNNEKETSEDNTMYKLTKSEREISEEKKKDIQIRHKKGNKMKYNELT